LENAGNAELKLTPAGKMFLLAGCNENLGNDADSQVGEKAESPSNYLQ
jgi:hypothetical protein